MNGPAPRPLVAVACDGCGADEYEPVTLIEADYEYLGLLPAELARRQFRIVRCQRCGLFYLNPRPDAEEILRYYPDVYGCFSECPPRGRLMRLLYEVMLHLKRRELLPRLRKDGILVDLGCGNGHWLLGLRKGALASQRLIGVDFSEREIEKLKTQGIEAYVGDEQALGPVLQPGSVDLILMNHVIEHLPHPRQTLRRLVPLLRAGGEIHGVTPNVDAWDRSVFGQYWAGWHPPRHFVLFDRTRLDAYARDAGLELVQCRSEFEGATHWSVSAHTLLTQKVWRLRPQQYRLPIYPLLLVGAMGIAAVQKLVSRTSIMSFVFRKPDSTAAGPDPGRAGATPRPA